MSELIIYLSAAAFIIYIFPVHVYTYVYVTTQKGYINLNVSLFKFIPLYKGHFKLKPSFKDIKPLFKNDGGLKLKYPSHYIDLYNKLCITKIIQVGDFGIQNEDNVYLALAQNSLTQALYTFVKVNGGRTKLKNYVVLNNEHDYISYCLKLVGVINLIVLIRVFIVYFWSVLNERKI